jgi:ubiquinone/menaquinone biosynthesis C-methylase UbiE
MEKIMVKEYLEETQQVRDYWESNPLLSLELPENYGDEQFFKEFERIKFEDIEPYSLQYWNFNAYQGKKVLDIGCGPGWYTVNYARGGANVTGIDLTNKAVELATKFLQIEGLKNAVARQGDAQRLTFEDCYFDLVVSSGVLHHVPNPMATFKEVRRVLKPGGEAKITLYYQNCLLRNKWIFRLMLFVLKILKVRHHNVNSGSDPKTPEDFVRMYDGKENPIGIAKDDQGWRKMFSEAGFEVESSEVHFFPIRFINNMFPFKLLRKFFDRNFGFMIYYRLKPM